MAEETDSTPSTKKDYIVFLDTKPVTVSIGVAELDSYLKDPDDVLGRADKALYKAKGAGKNKVCLLPCERGKNNGR